MGGPTLFVLMTKARGTSVRRLIGIDPQTLGMRFDLGELGSEPNDDWDRQMVSNGYIMVFVASPTDDSDACDLHAVDTTSGRTLWKVPVGEWFAHYFLGGYLVVRSREKLQILKPDTGQPLAAFP